MAPIDTIESPTHTRTMNLSELIEGELIFLGALCSTKEELTVKLLDAAYRTNRAPLLPQEEVLNLIDLREKIGGTLLPSGLSVPHARIKDYEDFILVLGIPAEPLFHEGIQIRLMALMLSSQIGGPFYLPTLAALTKISLDSDYMTSLHGADSPSDFIRIVQERDIIII